MKLQWKLREKLVLHSLIIGLVPLLIVITYIGYRGSVLMEKQALEYLKAEVDGFAQLVELRNRSIEGNLDVIKNQLRKNIKEELIKTASSERYFESGYLVIFNTNGVCVYHPKADYRNNTVLYDTYDFVQKAIAQKQGFFRYTMDGTEKCSYLAYFKDLDWIIWGAAPFREIVAEVNMLRVQMYIFLAIVCVIICIQSVYISTRISRRAKDISNRMIDIAQGEADLSARLPVDSTDEIGDIAHWFNQFIENLEEVIMKVKSAALQVDLATQEVAAGSQGLSQTTQEQASAIEEVAATIEEMTSSIKQNASNASQGREKAQTMVKMANTSSESSQELVQAMGNISDASKKIGDIIVTVNEVSFQTNLLALNAAVEAARAGEHGKGFAVVAEEVRALAQRSADAARQIKDLIEDTVSKIEAGDLMVKKSGESLEEIIKHIEDLSLTMDEIATASSEQASGVDELNRAVAQIDTTTQQNASTVEELASTSDNLRNESRDLADTVERFKVSQKNMRGRRKKKIRQPDPENIPHTASHTAAPQAIVRDDFEEF